ncbi:MAG: hypothetical protein MZU91_01315 [Desulfosudis oleivorans]|nr:hypothetical protein [Desulfosudis oleivorans]
MRDHRAAGARSTGGTPAELADRLLALIARGVAHRRGFTYAHGPDSPRQTPSLAGGLTKVLTSTAVVSRQRDSTPP